MSTSVSSVVSHFPDAENGFTTTTAGSVSSGATTVTLNSIGGYTNGMPVVLVIDPTDASKKQTFTGIVDTSGVQITSVVWTAGTNQTHALGATVVDYAAATHIAMMSKGILVDHSQSGGHEVATNYDPSNVTLETQKWVGVSSAVNELTVTNAATGNPPVLSATGSDTNIDLNLTGKGTGSARFRGIHDGWITANETFTYASATTFTCSADLAANLSTGDKIKLTQTSAKYFYVTGISGTTITVNGGTDYTLANAAITLPFYSKAASPTGFPQSFAYTPTFANFTKGSAAIVSKFSMTGKTVWGTLSVVLAADSTMGTAPTFTVPVTAAGTGTYPTATLSINVIGKLNMLDSGTAGYSGDVALTSTTVATLIVLGTAGSYLNTANPTAAVPFGWTTNDAFVCEYSYEAA